MVFTLHHWVISSSQKKFIRHSQKGYKYGNSNQKNRGYVSERLAISQNGALRWLALLGYVIHFDTTGIEFVMTALFVVMFINQWEEANDHKPALVGVGCSVICLMIFGSDNFILPAMASIILCFVGMKKHDENKRKERLGKAEKTIS